MMGIESHWLTGTLVVLQALGLASVAAARCQLAAAVTGHWPYVAFGWMGVIGAATLGAIMLGSAHWLPCGATFTAMVVTATYDSGRTGLDQPL